MSDKIVLTPYELMTMMGAVDPCMSDRLKAALEIETSKPKYQDLNISDATAIAIYQLAKNAPESFDPDNKDDVAAQRLSSVLVNDDGTIATAEELAARIEPMDASAVDQEPKPAPKKDRPKPFPRSGKLTNKHIDQGLRLLKNEILEAEDFHDLFEFFLDEYGENPRFRAHGKMISKAPLLVEALKAVATRLFPDGQNKVDNLRLTQLKKHHFIHGYAHVNDLPTIVFAFEDMGIGMAAIAQPDGETHCMRITVGVPSDNS